MGGDGVELTGSVGISVFKQFVYKLDLGRFRDYFLIHCNI